MGRKRNFSAFEPRRKIKALDISEKCETDEVLDYEPEETSLNDYRSDEDDYELNEFRKKIEQTSKRIHNVNNVRVTSQPSSISHSSYREEMIPILSTGSNQQSEYLLPQVNGTSTLLDSSDDESTEPLTAVEEETLLEESDEENSFFDRSIEDKVDSCFNNIDGDERNLPDYESEDERFSFRKHSDRSERDTSSEKSDQNIEDTNEPILQSVVLKNAVICVSGGVRTVTRHPPQETLKRPTNDICQIKRIKKPKWNVSFANSYEPTQIYLKDIGYDSPEKDNSENINSKNFEDQNMVQGTLRVSLDRDAGNRLCKKVNNTSLVRVIGNQTEDSFKIPLLPPAKRPPTRIKSKEDKVVPSITRTVSNFGANSTISVSSSKPDDDVISIAASSTWCSIEDSLETGTIKDEPSDVDERLSNPFSDFGDYERVETWVRDQSESSKSTENVPVSLQPLIPAQDGPTHQGNTGPVDQKGTHRIDFWTIPSVFQGMCFFHYVNQCCSNRKCSLPHAISIPKYASKLIHVSPARVLEAYNFMVHKNLRILYKEIYPSFIKGFIHHNMKNELISCIYHFYTFEVDLFDSVSMVVNGLQEMGLSFIDAIEFSVLMVGLKLPDFGNILLELLTSKTEIAENWKTIKKIVLTLGRISPKQAMKIFHLATNVLPLDKMLLLDINDVIIKNNLTDLTQISKNALIPFKIVEGFNENTSRIPVTQTVTRLSMPTNNGSIAVIPSENLRNNLKRPELPNNDLSNNINNNQSRIRRIYDTSTGRVTASNSSVSSTDSDDRHLTSSSSSTGHRSMERAKASHSTSPVTLESISFSNNQYVPQHIVPENRQHNRLENNNYVSQPDYTLSPSPPNVGKTKLPRIFDVHNSLHYLYPEVIKHQVPLDDADHLVLKKAIHEVDAVSFFGLLDKYKTGATLEKFIIMSIINLKDHLGDTPEKLKALLSKIGFESLDVNTKKMVKIIFEVIVMNLLVEMEKACRTKAAVELLEHFTDWDSLVTSQMFGSRKFSHMGKYLYLAKLLCKGRNFYYTYRILMCPELHLMNNPSTWPYFYNKKDLQIRNDIINDFLQEGYSIYPVGPLYMHKYMLSSAEMYGYSRTDQQNHLNKMLRSILESGQTSSLAGFFDFLDCFYKILDKSTLRSLASALVDRLSSKEQRIQLYEICCRREIYQSYSGEESEIIIRTDNTDNEIFLIFTFFFHKKCQVPSHFLTDLVIGIRLQENGPGYVTMINGSLRSIVETNQAVRDILRNQFNILVRNSSNRTSLEVPIHELSTILMK